MRALKMFGTAERFHLPFLTGLANPSKTSHTEEPVALQMSKTG
jgi:hypothetical protein